MYCVVEIKCQRCGQTTDYHHDPKNSYIGMFLHCAIKSCDMPIVEIAGIVEKDNGDVFCIYIPVSTNQHCINHPEIMFNQVACPMCKLEKDLRGLINER